MYQNAELWSLVQVITHLQQTPAPKIQRWKDFKSYKNRQLAMRLCLQGRPEEPYPGSLANMTA